MSNVTLPADCSLRSVHPIQEQLAAAFHAGDAITLDCSAVAHADLAGVQLLISATRTAQAADRQFRLTGVSDILAAVLTRAGFALAPSGDRIIINKG